MTKKVFGKTQSGQEVTLYTLENANGMKANVTDFGAILVNLFVPDGKGGTKDVVLGYDNVAEYEENGCFFGATIAPSANRVDKAAFTINGKKYQMDVNENDNNLHSHFTKGAHKRIWDVKEGAGEITFSLKMADGDLGCPGNKTISVTYALTDDNALKLTYGATTDADTLINPTNHTYFNLSGHESGSILDTVLTINANQFTEIRNGGIPTGKLIDVAGSIMDFTKGRRIGDDIEKDYEQIVMTGGYDHNFAVNGYDGKLQVIAKAFDPRSGLSMEVSSDLPGVQFYAGNFIAEQTGKAGAKYGKRCGFCLETQFFPNAINEASFISPVLKAGKEFASTTVYRFF